MMDNDTVASLPSWNFVKILDPLVTIPSRMFRELSLCVNGQESEYPFSVNAYESDYSKFDESGNI